MPPLLPTGLVYHPAMLSHFDPNTDHPECPERIEVMMQVLIASDLSSRMLSLPISPCSPADLLLVHSQAHLDTVNSLANTETRLNQRFDLEFRSAFASAGTVEAAYLAAGGCVAACAAVLHGQVRNALCLVRPPGHHAEHDQLGGFCFFNSVAVAAAASLERLGARRVLIVDWDVHHGNGIQHMFYNSDQVMYISVHRWHGGDFYPGGPDGGPSRTGVARGRGFNINIGWTEPYGTYGDAELLCAWDQVVLPAGRAFDPDLVLVSAGFDAAEGDPLGGCHVTPAGYGHLLHALQALAGGRLVVALEGGYSLEALSASGLVCAQVLIGAPPPPLPRLPAPSPEAVHAIAQTIEAHLNLDVELARAWTSRYASPGDTMDESPPPPRAQNSFEMLDRLPDEHEHFYRGAEGEQHHHAALVDMGIASTPLVSPRSPASPSGEQVQPAETAAVGEEDL